MASWKRLITLAEQRLDGLKNGTETLLDEHDVFLSEQPGDTEWAQMQVRSAADAWVAKQRKPKVNGSATRT